MTHNADRNYCKAGGKKSLQASSANLLCLSIGRGSDFKFLLERVQGLRHWVRAFGINARRCVGLFDLVALAVTQQFGTAEEARTMLDRAAAALKSDEAKALRALDDTNNKLFHDRDFLHLLLQYV